MRKWILLFLGLAFVFSGIAQAQSRYNNQKYGFSIVPPEKWTRIPVRPTEKWIVARFKSKKEYETAEGARHCPTMKVILFPKAKGKPTGSLGGAEKEPSIEDLLKKLSNPYKTYREYLKGNFHQGGYFVSKDDPGKVGKLPVTMLEIKVEKLAYYGKQRFITWVFHAPIGDFAVETGVLEKQFKKLSSPIYASLKTFAVIKRVEGAEDGEGDTGIRLAAKTPEERKKQRIKYVENVFEKARSDLPPGWKVMEKKHFLVIYHTPDSKAIKYSNQADVFRSWLDKNFGKIGKEYCGRCILRICKDWDEEKVYRDQSVSGFSFENREITTNVSSEDRAFEFEWINKRVLHKFFSDKNELLWEGLPFWLEKGLDQYLGTAIARGKRLVFKPDRWEKENLTEGRRNDKLRALKDLMLMTSDDVGNNRDDMQIFLAQCGSVIRYFFGPGNKGFTKDLVFKYIENLIAILEEREKKEEEELRKRIKKSGEPMTEEEEEEEYKKRRKAQSKAEWFRKKKEVLEETYKRTFSKWKDQHWTVLNNNWKAFAK
ncbi:MAG: hypothetical protein ACYTHM_01350 [Planctomycetota bacterium]|jgi:hypothetical protein